MKQNNYNLVGNLLFFSKRITLQHIRPTIYAVNFFLVCHIIQCVPLATEPTHFFNNFTTNEDIVTTTDTFLFISHTTKVLLFKFRCNIFIGVKMIKEMPSSVASGTPCMCGPGSSVGIATELRDGRSGIESRLGRDFPTFLTGHGAHPASYKMGTGSFPGVKCGRGVLLTTHLLLVPRSWKSTAIPLPTLWSTPGL